MDLSKCEQLDERIEKAKNRELSALSLTDPDYGRKVNDIERRTR